MQTIIFLNHDLNGQTFYYEVKKDNIISKQGGYQLINPARVDVPIEGKVFVPFHSILSIETNESQKTE